MRPVASAYRFNTQPQLVRLSAEDQSRRQHLACFLRVAAVGLLIAAAFIVYAALR